MFPYHTSTSAAASSLHHPPVSPGLAECAGDGAPALVTRRIALGRELAALLVRQSLTSCDPADVRRALGYRSRQGLHHLTDARRPGITLAATLVAPRPFASAVLLGALARLDLLVPARRLYTPQQLVAQVVAGAAQVAVVLDQRELDGCTDDQLEQLATTIAEQQQRLAELAARVAVTREAKRASQGAR